MTGCSLFFGSGGQVEYVNDVNREYTEVLLEFNVNGLMDTAYGCGNKRLANVKFTGWTGDYTCDPGQRDQSDG